MTLVPVALLAGGATARLYLGAVRRAASRLARNRTRGYAARRLLRVEWTAAALAVWASAGPAALAAALLGFWAVRTFALARAGRRHG